MHSIVVKLGCRDVRMGKSNNIGDRVTVSEN